MYFLLTVKAIRMNWSCVAFIAVSNARNIPGLNNMIMVLPIYNNAVVGEPSSAVAFTWSVSSRIVLVSQNLQ